MYIPNMKMAFGLYPLVINTMRHFVLKRYLVSSLSQLPSIRGRQISVYSQSCPFIRNKYDMYVCVFTEYNVSICIGLFTCSVVTRMVNPIRLTIGLCSPNSLQTHLM